MSSEVLAGSFGAQHEQWLFDCHLVPAVAQANDINMPSPTTITMGKTFLNGRSIHRLQKYIAYAYTKRDLRYFHREGHRSIDPDVVSC